MAAASRPLLLGEWACLGVLMEEPTHGYTVALRLAPDGDLGRIWSISRALTYRAIDHLLEHGYARELRAEPGIAGGMRTPLAPTAKGKKAFLVWLAQPVEHLRDVRSELLLKIQLSSNLGIDAAPLIASQRAVFEPLVASLRHAPDVEEDAVALWRCEYSLAAMRFIDRLAAPKRRTTRSGTG